MFLFLKAYWNSFIYQVFDGNVVDWWLFYRGDCDVYSLVDISGTSHKETSQKSNVVVDTIRIISGIPQSRMNDILSETENNGEASEDKEYLVGV